MDYIECILQNLSECRVMLVIIGRQWAENPRLQEESDFVRIEIEHGLEPECDILVVPVLVGDASMPSTDQLPPSLKDFAYRNAINVRPDPDFHRDMDKLTRGLEGLLDIPLADEQPAVIKAAEEGDAEAQYNLGVMYANGEGVEKDYEEAARWYRKAAEQGNAVAQHNLGGSMDIPSEDDQGKPPPKIFISYRREDCESSANRLAGDLIDRFGKRNVFFDVDSISLGRDYLEDLDDYISKCNVLLALIGKSWITAKNEDGSLRLFDEDDPVRQEITRAMDQGILVIPVRVDRADMPVKKMVPSEMKKFLRRQALEVRPAGRDYHGDVAYLIENLEPL